MSDNGYEVLARNELDDVNRSVQEESILAHGLKAIAYAVLALLEEAQYQEGNEKR